jgi:hypothetical protein
MSNEPINQRTVNSTSDYILWTLYRSYFNAISANIELQIYSEYDRTSNETNNKLRIGVSSKIPRGVLDGRIVSHSPTLPWMT